MHHLKQLSINFAISPRPVLPLQTQIRTYQNPLWAKLPTKGERQFSREAVNQETHIVKCLLGPPGVVVPEVVLVQRAQVHLAGQHAPGATNSLSMVPHHIKASRALEKLR